ncbi:MAG TPA: A/G-specific adenine glycosylase [Thermoplasmata archaeon]|jgi:A/G-specific adenine glycosylase|nr:A/G-specific adenine glycosylase [Thermoplasmata archaeon]
MGEPSLDEIRHRLLGWYRVSHRDLPWRRTQDPYKVLVAEYLLQRTRIASGQPYYERFVSRFPTVRDLAAAPLDDVLAVWEGLGFYRRAKHLHAAARAMVERHGGKVPSSYPELAALPGIGPYTTGAVASIAFGLPVPAVDGNVTRVIARLFRLHGDVTSLAIRREVAELAARLVSREEPGAFNQAMMELGATICTPKSPACGRCPLETLCLARAAGEERGIPVTPRRRPNRTVHVAFALIESHGRVLLARREEGGLLGGLWALPGGEVPSSRSTRKALRKMVKEQTGIEVTVGPAWAPVEQTFSHRKWSGTIFRCSPPRRSRPRDQVRWLPVRDALKLPLVPFHREALASLAGLESFDRR